MRDIPMSHCIAHISGRCLLSLVALAMPVAVLASVADKPVAKKTAQVSKVPAAKLAPTSKAKPVIVVPPVPDAPLTESELAIAQQIEPGAVSCELGVVVTVKADPQAPGYFDLHLKQQKFRMVPVVSSTGAIRLEDRKAGAVWLQLANKSMLMNQKLGQRLADVCMNRAQAEFAAAMEKAPPVSLLEVPKVPAPTANTAVAGAANSPAIAPVQLSAAPPTTSSALPEPVTAPTKDEALLAKVAPPAPATAPTFATK